jgi:ribose transport system permease protein
MTATPAMRTRPSELSFWAVRNRSMLISFAVFLVILSGIDLFGTQSISYFDIASLANSAGTLALVAIGQTLVVLTGGFDLSAGGMVSLGNAILITQMHDTLLSQAAWPAAVLVFGGLSGAVNGYFVAYLRLQPIIVTLSTMVLLRGLTLLILPSPGGTISAGFVSLFTGDAISNLLPSAVIVVAAALLVWSMIRRSRLGTAIYAMGCDERAARASGIRVRSSKMATYVIAGIFYGVAAIFVTAETGSGDPQVGTPLLLDSFTAVVLGGTVLGGGKGGCFGSVIGAYILTLLTNVMLILNVSTYLTTVVEGIMLIVAALGHSFGRAAPVARSMESLLLHLKGWRDGTLVSQVLRHRPLAKPPLIGPDTASASAAAGATGSWLERNRETLRLIAPSYLAFLGIIVATGFVFPHMIVSWHYYDHLGVLVTFLAILALGQGAVIVSGGFDLSVTWSVTFFAIFSSSLMNSSDVAALWVVLLTLILGALVGIWNGATVAFLGLPPIVATLATNGILQGLALYYSGTSNGAFAPPSLRWLMTGEMYGVTPVLVPLAVFVVFGALLLGRTPLGRRLRAIGSSVQVANYSGVNVARTTVAVYALSGACSALVGVLLVAFSGQPSLAMGNEYLLPSIAVVVIGGTLITGGRGYYLGMLGGVLLLTALETLLAGTTLPFAVRDIIFGLIILGSVMTQREGGD